MVSLSEPDSALIARVQLSQVAAAKGFVEGVIDIFVRTCENSRHMLENPPKLIVASLLKRLDRHLVAELCQVDCPVKEYFLLEKALVVAVQIRAQKQRPKLVEVRDTCPILFLGHNPVHRVKFVVWELSLE